MALIKTGLRWPGSAKCNRNKENTNAKEKTQMQKRKHNTPTKTEVIPLPWKTNSLNLPCTTVVPRLLSVMEFVCSGFGSVYTLLRFRMIHEQHASCPLGVIL